MYLRICRDIAFVTVFGEELTRRWPFVSNTSITTDPAATVKSFTSSTVPLLARAGVPTSLALGSFAAQPHRRVVCS